MKQEALRSQLEALLADLVGMYDPNAHARESITNWLVDVAREAAFGELAVGLDRDGAAAALATIESVAREPMNLEVRISRRRSEVRNPERDFFVELRGCDGTLAAKGAAPTLALAAMHAVCKENN